MYTDSFTSLYIIYDMKRRVIEDDLVCVCVYMCVCVRVCACVCVFNDITAIKLDDDNLYVILNEPLVAYCHA